MIDSKRFEKVKKRITFWQDTYTIVLILLSFLFFLSLYRNLQKIGKVEKRLADKEEKVRQLEQKNKEIGEKLEKISSQEYVEKKLRDDLGLVREGETIFVLPDENLLRSLVPELPNEEEELPPPNWKKWLDLLK